MTIPFYEIKQEPIVVDTCNRMDFPLHMHAEVEIILMKKGRLSVRIRDESHTLEAGDLFIACPEIPHAYDTLTPPEDTLLTIAIVHPRFSDINRPLLTSRIPQCPVVHSAALHPDVRYCLDGLAAMKAPGDDMAVAGAYVQLLLGRLLPALAYDKPEPDSGSQLTSRIVALLADHFHEQLSLGDVARQIGVSKSYLSRFFNTKMHIGFTAYIHTLRVNLAKELLCKTDWPILHIGEACGYETQRTFNRAFHAMTGMTPRQWRERAAHSLPGG